MHYVYRCTTDKLGDALDRIIESGDEVLWPVYAGGRDWLVLCRRKVEADQ